MKRTLASILLLATASIAKAQNTYFEIKPYVINKVIVSGGKSYVSKSDTADKVGIGICGIGDSTCVNYCLYARSGDVIESGVKYVPLQAVGVLTDRPIRIDAVNSFFAYWRIEAIEQLFNFR